jgi:hypothetical protein
VLAVVDQQQEVLVAQIADHPFADVAVTRGSVEWYGEGVGDRDRHLTGFADGGEPSPEGAVGEGLGGARHSGQRQ